MLWVCDARCRRGGRGRGALQERDGEGRCCGRPSPRARVRVRVRLHAMRGGAVVVCALNVEESSVEEEDKGMEKIGDRAQRGE